MAGSSRTVHPTTQVETLLKEILPPVSPSELEAEVSTVMKIFGSSEDIDVFDFVSAVRANKYWQDAGELTVKELIYLDALQVSA